MESSPSAHLTRLAFGPTIDGLFLQTNLAIVTKMGIHLTPQPQAYMVVNFDMPNFEDISTLIDMFGQLRRSGTIPTSVFIGNIVGQTTVVHKHEDWWVEGGPIPDWRLKEIQQELDMGYWIVKFGLYGPENILRAQFDEVKRVVTETTPQAAHRLKSTLYAGENGELLEATAVTGPHGGVYVGVPGMANLQFVDYLTPKNGSGIGGHGAYSPIVPLDGDKVLDWVKAARQVYESHGFDLICDFFVDQRHSVSVCMLFFDKTNPEHRLANDKLMHGLFEEGRKRGLSKYRSHVAYMGAIPRIFLTHIKLVVER